VRNEDDIALFQEEAAELIESLEGGLLALEQERSDEVINSVFRAIHTIKGGAGLVGMDELAYFAHDVEHLMQHVRDGAVEPDDDVIEVLLGATDLVRMFVAENVPDADATQPVMRALHAALARRGLKPPKPLELPGRSVAPPSAGAQANEGQSARDANGGTPPVPRAFEVPMFSVMPPDGSADAVRAKWGFLFNSSPPPAQLEQSMEDPNATHPASEPTTPSGESAFPAAGDSIAAPVRVIERKRAVATESKPEPASTTVRVPLEKLDRLVNLVGELVIAHATIAQLVGQVDTTRVPALVESVGVMERHCRELQERVLGVRMLPIETTFGRFQRLARDLGAACGKRLELTLEGGETELDKTVLESMTDPLTHLVRNAIDHGLESPEERRAAGKPEVAKLVIRAAQKSGNVRIEISDDGRGLDRDRILAKAAKQGLVDTGEPIDDASVFALVFRPGFSTRDEVSSLSGRGVGLDVVKSAVEKLKGTVSIHTERGVGTTFRITLPLTMAILDGLALEVAGQVYVLPLVAVVESVRVDAKQIRRLANRQEVAEVRDGLHPLVRLGELFGTPAHGDDPARCIVVIVDDGVRRYSLLVDDVVGQYQVVVKSLETNYGRVAGLSGATILGDGRVALILDPIALADLARTRARASAQAEAAE